MIRDRKAWRSYRGPRPALLAAVMLAGLSLGASPGRASARALGRPAPGPGQADVTVPARTRTTAIPRAFLGLSTEYATLPIVERHTRLYERVLSLLQVPGDGRFVLRIGGDSADHAVFDPSSYRLPPR